MLPSSFNKMMTTATLAIIVMSAISCYSTMKQSGVVVSAFSPQLGVKHPATHSSASASSASASTALLNQPSSYYYYDNHPSSSSLLILHNSLYNDDDEEEQQDSSSSSIPMNNSTSTTATVKRKKKGKYQTVSNGVAGGGKGKNNKKSKNPPGTNHANYYPHPDTLPFLVKVTTPDPYTNNEDMKQRAIQNTKHDREFQKYKQQEQKKKKNNKNNTNTNNKKKKNGSTRRRQLTNSISSSIYTRHEDGTLQKILGEFTLDKSTCSGDIITVNTANNVLTTTDDDGFSTSADTINSNSDSNTGGRMTTTEVEYQVQSAKSQYKYVGGQKFVMVRKILEVKEIKRLLVEQEIQELFDRDISMDEDDDSYYESPPLLE